VRREIVEFYVVLVIAIKTEKYVYVVKLPAPIDSGVACQPAAVCGPLLS